MPCVLHGTFNVFVVDLILFSFALVCSSFSLSAVIFFVILIHGILKLLSFVVVLRLNSNAVALSRFLFVSIFIGCFLWHIVLCVNKSLLPVCSLVVLPRLLSSFFIILSRFAVECIYCRKMKSSNEINAHVAGRAQTAIACVLYAVVCTAFTQ